ncbi:hypothetical protein ACFLUK_03450 [Chloroflexota bacterium]
MVLNKDKEKKAAAIFERVLDEYVEKKVINTTEHSAENLCIVFGYKNTTNLVKHSNTLTELTIGLIVLGAGMIALTMQQANLWPFSLW